MLVSDSLTNSLTHSCLVNLIDVAVTVVDVRDEDRVGNSLLQIWKLRFGLKDFEHFGQDFEVEVQARF